MSGGTRAHVLVIDDDSGMRDMLAYELSMEGFDVEAVDGGPAALEAMKRWRFDVALTDLKMPGMDGIEALAALRRLDPDIEVIVGTGHATIDTAVACMKGGAYDYVQKPYELHELTALLRRAAEKAHLQGAVALYDSSRQLLETLDTEEVTVLLTSLAPRVLRADAVGLALDERVHAGETIDGEPLAEELLEELFHVADGALEPMRLPRDGDELPPASRAVGFGAAVVYPLVTRGRTSGHLALLRRTDRPQFSRSELQRGAILAGQIALSTDNARLYQELGGRLDELVEAQAQLVQAERLAATGHLARCVAHEINNPLAYVKANLETLRGYGALVASLWGAAERVAGHLERHDPSPEARRLLDDLLATDRPEGDDPAHLVDDVAELIAESLDGLERIGGLVSEFDRMSHPTDRGTSEAVELHPLIREAIEALPACRRPLPEDLRGCPEGLHARAVADDLRTAVGDVLRFLTGHDQRAAGDPCPIRVLCSSEDEAVALTIIDDGLVLSEAERRRALAPRIGPETMRLDLALFRAHELVRRNDGDLGLDATSSETCVRVVLPRADAR